VGVSAAFYVLMSYAISIGLGKSAVDQGAWLDPAALDNLATQYIGKSYAGLVDLVVILDATALALAICVTIGRGYFALGRDGLLPSVFAKTSRHNTPWVGNLMVVVGGVGLILIGMYSHTMDRFIPIAGSRELSGSWSRRLPGRSRSSSSTSRCQWRRSACWSGTTAPGGSTSS
jgi:amino acid transporter